MMDSAPNTEESCRNQEALSRGTTLFILFVHSFYFIYLSKLFLHIISAMSLTGRKKIQCKLFAVTELSNVTVINLMQRINLLLVTCCPF